VNLHTTFLLTVFVFRYSLGKDAFVILTGNLWAHPGALNRFLTRRILRRDHWNHRLRLKLLSYLNYLQILKSGVNKAIFYLLYPWVLDLNNRKHICFPLSTYINYINFVQRRHIIIMFILEETKIEISKLWHILFRLIAPSFWCSM
jgi:hypothetical protein